MSWVAGYLERYVEGSMFASLNDILEEGLQDEFVPGTTEAYAIADNVYGLPLELNIVHVYYNKAIFDEHGLDEPTTYEELVEVVETLNDNGVEPIALGNRDRWTGSMWFMYLADRIGGGELLTQAIEREESFEDTAFVQVADNVHDIVDNGAFIDGFNGLADEEAKSMYVYE